MSANTANPRDVRTEAIVLRRTNYGETDRIINIITTDGIVAVMAKSVRKEKSKLAGGIELFCLSEITYHRGRSSLATLTSAKMKKFYKNILSSLDKMELAAEVLRKISRAAEHVDSPDFFRLTRDTLDALDSSNNLELIETYFRLNLAAISGEATNFWRDTSGNKLSIEESYSWDSTELAFAPHPQGKYRADDIKYLRLMVSSPLSLATRVKYPAERLGDLLFIAKTLAQG